MTSKRKTESLKLSGFTLLEVLLSIFLLSTLTLFILHLAAIRGNVSKSMEEKSLKSGVTELLKAKYLEINQSPPKYQLKDSTDAQVLISDETMEDKKVRVFGRKENAFITKYRILIATTASPSEILEDISYSHFQTRQ